MEEIIKNTEEVINVVDEVIEPITGVNSYIMNIEGAYIFKDVIKGEKYKVPENRIKLYSATMPFSIEVNRLKEYYPTAIYLEGDKQYTDAFINVNFDKDSFEEIEVTNEETGEITKKAKFLANNDAIRDYLYFYGFDLVNGEKTTHYKFYKRGASKARTGSDIFIDKDMFEKLIDRSRLGIKFDESRIDMTSIYAYESLIMSGLDFLIELDPKTEILLIDDIYGKEFTSKASVTRQNDKGRLVTKEEDLLQQNCLTDGQGLLCESVLQKYGKADKSFMLLRSDWLKCCAFSTKLQKFFSENSEHIKDGKIKDMVGRELEASKIKLVISPNSLKWLKNTYKFADKPLEELTEDEMKAATKKCYEHWLDNIDKIFGVVKMDKVGNYGSQNRLTYQLLNSMQLTPKEVESLVVYEIDYLMKLKNDYAYFRNYISSTDDILELYDELELEDEEIFENKNTKDILSSLIAVNSDVQYTKKFTDFKDKQIKYYTDNLRCGKIRMKDTIYATVVSNPYSMLQATLGLYKEGEVSQEGREMWCKFYKEGLELCSSRNPHINSGNILHLTNKYHDEYKWFNLGDNVVVISANDNDILQKAQGMDTDSDSVLLCPSDLLKQKALEYQDKWLTPINMVKGIKDIKDNNMHELAKLDSFLQENFIGSIVNLSQIAASYMNQAIVKNKCGENDKLINKLYEITSKLSSLSQVELDRAKKSFIGLNMNKELKKITRTKINNKLIFKFHQENTGTYRKNKNEEEVEIIKKYLIVPTFFKFVQDRRKKYKYKPFETAMDYLQKILDEKIIRKTRNDKGIKKTEINEQNKTWKDLLVRQKDLEEGIADTDQIKVIYDIISEYGKVVYGLASKTNSINKIEDKETRRNIKNAIMKKSEKKAIDSLDKLKINSKTILAVLRQALGVSMDKHGFMKYGIFTLSLLYKSKPNQTLKCFINKQNDKVLIKAANGDIDIFGEKYILVGMNQAEKWHEEALKLKKASGQ